MLEKLQQMEVPKLFLDHEPVWNLYEHGITQSFLTTFKCCRKKTEYVYYRGYRKRTAGLSAILEYGNLFHHILELFNAHPDRTDLLQPKNYGDMKTEIYKIVTKFEESKFDLLVAGDLSSEALEKFSTLCAIAKPQAFRYFEFWRETFLGWKWLSLEEVFKTDYKGKYGNIPITGKRDGQVELDGKEFLFETKTKSDISTDMHLMKLQFDFQTMLYMYTMFLETGRWPRGFIYNLVRRPMLRVKNTESLAGFSARIDAALEAEPEEYFTKIESRVPQHVILDWAECDLFPLIHDVEVWFKNIETRSYRNNAICTMYNSPCAYLPLCAGLSKEDYIVENTVFGELSSGDAGTPA